MLSAGGMRRDLGRGFRHQHDLYQISYAVCCMLLYVVKRKQRVESKRKERDEKREEGFAHRWSFFGCVRSLACSMLHPVVERSLWSAV